MTATTHEQFMAQAIELSRQAREAGNHPFGALLAVDGRVILTAQNSVNTAHDTTHHAELNLVSAATRQFDAATLARAVLYTSTEPCVMCAGAIFWAGISTVVYGCAAETLGALAGGALVIPCRDIFTRGNPQVQVIGPILEAEAAQLHQDFWQ